jgi:hypothetical protein
MHGVRFQDGKAVEHWGVRDRVGMLRQLGLMPEPHGEAVPRQEPDDGGPATSSPGVVNRRGGLCA